MTDTNIHGNTKKAADFALAKKQISRESHEAILRGELSLADGRALGRGRGPGTPEGRGGSRAATEGPREGQEAPADTPRDCRPRCLCGCGGTPKGKKSRFVMGHDAKLRSELAAQIRKGDVLLRADRITPEQRAFAVRHGLIGGEALPSDERSGE